MVATFEYYFNPGIAQDVQASLDNRMAIDHASASRSLPAPRPSWQRGASRTNAYGLCDPNPEGFIPINAGFLPDRAVIPDGFFRVES